MNQSSQHSTHFLIIFLMLLLISSSKLSATFLGTKHGLKEISTNEVFLDKLKASEFADELMGLENCGEEDGIDNEECLKRRIISEAHLDYIYTQQHKP